MPAWRKGPLSFQVDPPDSPGGVGRLTVDHDSGGVLWAKFGAPADMAAEWSHDGPLSGCLSRGRRPVAFVVDVTATPGMMGKRETSEMLLGAMEALAGAGCARVFLVASPELGEDARGVVDFHRRHGFRVARGCGGPEDEAPVMRADL